LQALVPTQLDSCAPRLPQPVRNHSCRAGKRAADAHARASSTRTGRGCPSATKTSSWREVVTPETSCERPSVSPGRHRPCWTTESCRWCWPVGVPPVRRQATRAGNGYIGTSGATSPPMRCSAPADERRATRNTDIEQPSTIEHRSKTGMNLQLVLDLASRRPRDSRFATAIEQHVVARPTSRG
jgi:hypothetical protein